MPLGFGSSKRRGRLEVEVAADTDDFDEAMKEMPKKAAKASWRTSGASAREPWSRQARPSTQPLWRA